MTEASLLLRLARAADRRAAAQLRGLKAMRGPRVPVEQITLSSTAGYRVRAWVHLPVETPAPAIVLCPGIDDPGAVFDDIKTPITADEVARAGFVALRFDPTGRGESWGEEDFGGPEHQDNVDIALRYLTGRADVDGDRVGILSISLGVAMAVGAAARLKTPAAWILDWEGPCDREVITAGGTIMAPASGHSLEDDDYWTSREAVCHVGQLSCPYIRLQAEWDHAQPGELRHAYRMIHAAHGGTLPWFQINDHPRNQLPPRVRWIASGQLAAHRAILRKLEALHSLRRG
jgi:alpha/beta superfamily hydrolase